MDNDIKLFEEIRFILLGIDKRKSSTLELLIWGGLNDSKYVGAY